MHAGEGALKQHRHRQLAFPISAAAKLLISSFLIACASQAIAQASPSPSRWQAQYTQIYFDNVETIAPVLGPGFVLDTAGSLTSNPSEVVSGTSASIKGSYSGTGPYAQFLQTLPSIIPFSPGHSYQVTFQYNILTAPNNAFEVGFYSPTGGTQGNFLPQVNFTGAAGATGTATLTSTLGPYTDYYVLWQILGTGAISINNIQVIDLATGAVIATGNAETGPTVGPAYNSTVPPLSQTPHSSFPAAPPSRSATMPPFPLNPR
jgi:hypothetical protein